MSLITSSSASANFNVRTPAGATNKLQGATTSKIIKQDVGNAGAAIPPSFLLNHTIVVSPTGANQTYTLPTASAILAEFGKSIDTGVPKLAAGNSLVVRVVNRGGYPAYIASNPTGGDGSAIISYTGSATGIGGPGFTGSVAPVGKLTTIYLEWLAVNGGVNGATGQYTIYC